MEKSEHEAVSSLSLSEAASMLAAADKEGIRHVVTLIRDPRKPSRILGLNVAEAEPSA